MATASNGITDTVIIDDDNYDNILSYYQPSMVVNNNDTFASEMDFTKVHNIIAKPWRDLELGKIFHIKNLKRITTRNNEQAIILHLYAKDSDEAQIHWAPSLLAKELMFMKEMKNLYVKSTGMKRSITGRNYFSFQLVQKL